MRNHFHYNTITIVFKTWKNKVISIFMLYQEFQQLPKIIYLRKTYFLSVCVSFMATGPVNEYHLA